MEFWTTSPGLGRSRMGPTPLSAGYESFIAEAKAVEALGYDGYGSPEHHFMYDGFMPFPLQALAAVAAETSTIKLVTGAMLLTLYDPIEAAEAAATLDVLCGGRAVLGLGMGYRPMEFDGLGTAKRTRGARLVEAMEVIRLATSQERFSYSGKHYQYEDVGILPRPVQSPVDSWFCGGTSMKGATRAGTTGFGYWLANSPFDQTEAIVKEYRRVGRDAGRKQEELRIASFKDVLIGETVKDAEALRDALIWGFYEEHILGYGYLVDDQGNHIYNPPKDHPLYRRFVDSLFCGTVEMVIEELKRYEALGMEAVFVPSIQKDIMAAKIFPEFR